MIYLKKFENHEAYSAATLTLPNVSLCQQENEVHYNPYVPPFEMPSVDLGLPSGKKWSKYLLGMSGETDIENVLYFQWGDTEGHISADTKVNDWPHYKWCNGSWNTITKYCTDSEYGTVDGKSILEPEDDSAKAILGGNWRMPTYEEFRELINNTTYQVETINNVNGMRLTSKANENSIFIPFIGIWSWNGITNVGIYSLIWTCNSEKEGAITFRVDNRKQPNVSGLDARCDGLGVLGVID